MKIARIISAFALACCFVMPVMSSNIIRSPAPIVLGTAPKPDLPDYYAVSPANETGYTIAFDGVSRTSYWSPPNNSTVKRFFFGPTSQSGKGFTTFGSILCIKRTETFDFIHLADNSLNVYVDGASTGSFSGYWGGPRTRKVTLNEGCNKVQVIGYNDGKAGFIAFNFVSESGEIVFSSYPEYWEKYNSLTPTAQLADF